MALCFATTDCVVLSKPDFGPLQLKAIREKKTKIVERDAKRKKTFHSKKVDKEDEDLLEDPDEFNELLFDDAKDDFLTEKVNEDIRETKIFYASRTVRRYCSC